MPHPTFAPFSLQHGLTLAVGFAIIAAFVIAGRRGEEHERRARALLAFLNLTAYVVSQWAWANTAEDPGLDNIVPLHLCDIAAFLAGFALITRKPLLILLTYYWGLAGTVQGLLTPALDYGFPHPIAWAFFYQHFAIVAAAIYLTAAGGWRAGHPWWKSPLTAFLWLNAYVVLAISANAMLGTNFGFLAGKPTTPSLLDHLGPHPFYIVWLEMIALLLFTLLTLPVRAKQGAESGERRV